jgi:cell division protein FtsQ
MSHGREQALSRPLPLKQVGLGLGAVLALAAVGWAGVYALDPEQFPVRSVRFEGPFEHVSRQQVAQAAAPLARGNYFLADLAGVKREIQALPWVHRASVRRRWPDTVEVRFSEQRPVAQWHEDVWLNADAELVRLPVADVPSGLPRLTGPDGTHAQVLAQYTRFASLLAPAQQRITELDLSSRRTWRLTLDSGVRVAIGREQPEARLDRFARVYGETLAGQAEGIQQVDLHYTNGFSVEWRSSAARAGSHHKG